ncbi:MAG: DUF4331 domain-containing protein [Kofleriaceae bacterium]
MRILTVFSLGVALAGSALASSHREAPAIAEDPALDGSDLYVFRSPSDDPDAKDTVTIVATYWPFQDPAAPGHFAPDVYYRILIDTDGDAREDIVYQLAFETRYTNPKSTFAWNNVTQTGRLERLETKGNKRSEQRDLIVAPARTGPAAFPGAAYDDAARLAITPLTTKGGGKIFLGPRDDPYFADAGAMADMLAPRTGSGVDYLAGYNVHAIVLQLPIGALGDVVAGPHGKKSVIGVWTTGMRRKQITIAADNKRTGAGYQQVSRVGLPLINELLVPAEKKDAYNAALPRDDAKLLAPWLQDPDIVQLLRLGYRVPLKGRSDLVNVMAFNTGTAPLDVAGLASADLLRLDLSVPASALVPKTRLGLLGGDPAGFPNGRRLGDDVVDITLRIVAGAYCVKGKSCDVDAFPLPLGDAVDQNDAAFTPRFPYLAPPWSGAAGTPLHGKPATRP